MKRLLPCEGERRLEKRKLLVSLEAPKALGGFLHGRACPTQSHRRRAPVLCVPADAPHRAHDILDDVRAGERTPQFRRQSELCYGEHLVEPFQDRGGNALPVPFEMPGKVAKKRLGLAGVVQLPWRPQHAPHLCVHRDTSRQSRCRWLTWTSLECLVYCGYANERATSR